MSLRIIANKQSATTAAAAKAMDCFTFRANTQHKSSAVDAPLCLDALYLKDQGPEMPKGLIDELPAVEVKQCEAPAVKLVKREESTEKNESLERKVDNASIASANNLSKNVILDSTREKKTAAPAINSAAASIPKQPKSPKQLLNEHYAKLHLKIDKINYTTVKHDKVQVVKFATVFTCPQSGESFVGGRLRNEMYSNEDGVVWYGESEGNLV